MTKEEIEELKKDPIKFCKAFFNYEIQPYQETLISLMARNPKVNMISCQPRNYYKDRASKIYQQRTLLLMKEKEVFTIRTINGQATFLCIENTTGIK